MIKDLVDSFGTLPLVIQVLIIVFAFSLLKGFSIDLVFKRWILGKLNIKEKQCTPDDHATCGNYSDHLVQREQERLKGEKIGEIRYRGTVYEQMTKVRIYAEQMKTLLMKNYSSMLAMFDLDEKAISDAKIDYRKDLKIAIDEACGYLRKWVKNNHFVDKTDVQFNDYIHMRSLETIEKVTEVLDAYYLSSICVVPRNELLESNTKNVVPEAITLMSKMFFEIREISELKIAEIQKIDEEV